MQITTVILLAGLPLAAATAPGGRPVIATFAAAPAKVIAGHFSTLSWSVKGATTFTINQGVGAVGGTSVTVVPWATTSYTLTATNSFGSTTAAVTVLAGNPPAITGLTATPSKMSPGQTSTLSWVVTGFPGLTMTMNPGVVSVTGTSVKVRPSVSTSYTLTATNPFGSTTAAVTVMVGNPPAITSFSATPAHVNPGESSTLSWTVTGSPGLTVNQGVGPVTGTSVIVKPNATTAYILTATNAFGSVTATTTVAVTALPGSLPVINSFFATPASAGPGISTTLHWDTSGATSTGVGPGVGMIAGSSVTVSPTAATTYTLTATNASGSVTATVTVNYVSLAKVSSQLYYTEHAVFIIPAANQVTWTGTGSWDSVYSAANVDNYVSTLKSTFPSDYFFVAVAANNLTPNNVPSVVDYRHLAEGIGEPTIKGAGVPNICRYNIGGGTVIEGAFGVLDHEIGHNWEVFIGQEVGTGHWLANSTATGQMATTYSDDEYATVKQMAGDPVNGFTWTAVDNIKKNETETFSGQDLYLQGFAATFPDIYVLDSPVYNPDQTVSYSSFAKYDKAWVVQRNGVRNPSYRDSDKRLRMGFIYVARDLAEVQAVYQPIESSINHFVNAEQIDTTNFRFQVPFLADTQYRASIDALLADLDGNRTPTLAISGPASLVSSNGSAVVPFTAADPDGPAPAVSCVPAGANCSIQGANAVLTGLPSGSHFFTIKAQDTAGKKTFAHFVIDVQ